MNPKFSQEAASESVFKRDNVLPALVPRCCIPYHPHNWDHLTLIFNSVLTQLTGSSLTWGCLGLNSIITSPSYSAHSSTWKSPSLWHRFLLLNFNLGPCWWISVQVSAWHPIPGPCLSTPPSAWGWNTRLPPGCHLPFCTSKHHPLSSCCCALPTHWDTLLFHLGSFLIIVDFLEQWSEIVVPHTGQTESSLLVCGPSIWVQSYPRGRVISSPSPPCLPPSIVGSWPCPNMTNRNSTIGFDYLCFVIGELAGSPAHITQLWCIHVTTGALPYARCPVRWGKGRRTNAYLRFILWQLFIHML